MSALPWFAVVARPALAEPDRAWIESIRARHDPQAARIGLHVTLAFPAPLAPTAARDVLAEAAGVQAPFACAFDAVLAVREPGADRGHVYFVPNAGRAEFARLHDALYRGAFRPHFRADLPYVPHVTLAAVDGFARCTELAEQLARERRVVRGVVEECELVEVESVLVTTRATEPLGGRPGSHPE